MNDADRMHRLARYVASNVHNGARLGLGSGSTAEAVIRALGERVSAGSSFSGVPTSHRTAELARSSGITLLDFDQVDTLELGIDGADEISPQLDLVKGRGGALLYEKLVAQACNRLAIVAASDKLVDQLGTRLPLPVEVVPFGWRKTAACLRKQGVEPQLRLDSDGHPFHTDSGHYILDCTTGPIADAGELARELKSMTGVVDHGLFVRMATEAIVIDQDGNLISITHNGRRSIQFD